MSVGQLIHQHPTDTDQQIADRYNNAPESWKLITSAGFTNWLAGGARLAKLEGFVDATKTSTDPQTIGLRNAVRVAVESRNNHTVTIDLSPTSDHRTMLAALVASEVLSQSDADLLLTAGHARYAVTAGDVAQVRAAIAANAARNTLLNRAASLQSWITSQSSSPTGDEVKARWEAST